MFVPSVSHSVCYDVLGWLRGDVLCFVLFCGLGVGFVLFCGLGGSRLVLRLGGWVSCCFAAWWVGFVLFCGLGAARLGFRIVLRLGGKVPPTNGPKGEEHNVC